MREFFISDENRGRAYEILEGLLGEFFMDAPVYLQGAHITLLADVGKAISAIKTAGTADHFNFKAVGFLDDKDNVTYYNMTGTLYNPGAKHFFEKIDQALDEIICLLINNNNTLTIEVPVSPSGSEKITIQDAFKRLMTMLYKDYTFILRSTDPCKDFKIYTNYDKQLVIRSTVEHRKKLLEDLRTWTYTSWYKEKVRIQNIKIFNENEDLNMPAIYSNNNECFYFPFFTANNGEKGINFGGDAFNNRIEGQKCCDNFLKVMGFFPEVESEEDKSLYRIRYAKGFINRYADNPGCLYFNQKSVIFTDLSTYIRSSNGVLKQEQKINSLEMSKKVAKAAQKALCGTTDRFSRVWEQKEDVEMKQPSSSSSSSSSSSNPTVSPSTTSSLVPNSSSPSSSSQSTNSFSFLSSSSQNSGSSTTATTLSSTSSTSTSSSTAPITIKVDVMNATGIVLKITPLGEADKIMAALKEESKENTSVWTDGNEITFYAQDCQAGMFDNFLKLFNFKNLALVNELKLAVRSLTSSGPSVFTSKSQLASLCVNMFNKLLEEKPEFKASQIVPQTFGT